MGLTTLGTSCGDGIHAKKVRWKMERKLDKKTQLCTSNEYPDGDREAAHKEYCGVGYSESDERIIQTNHKVENH